MSRPLSQRAHEILEHAMRLFADKSYDGTSVADIQQAAGMTPGSGALYKHFSSKHELLEAGINRFIDEGVAATAELPQAESLDEELRLVGELVLKTLRQDEATLRVAWRDLRAFPALRKRFVDKRLQVGFREFASRLKAMADRGDVRAEDPQATAAVLLGALAFFRLMETLAGEKPLRLSDRRFLDAWVSVARGALDVEPEDTQAPARRRRG